jgi:hypothetical protein
MPDLTPRIGIKKPTGNENVSRASFNENWDIIDSKVATLGADGKVPSSQLNISSSADKITVADAGGYFTGTNKNVEVSLQQLGQTLGGLRTQLYTAQQNLANA